MERLRRYLHAWQWLTSAKLGQPSEDRDAAGSVARTTEGLLDSAPTPDSSASIADGGGAPSVDENVCLFDMDGTLADFEGHMMRDMKALRQPGEALPDVHGRDPHPAYIESRQHLIKSQSGWWRNLPKLQRGFDVLAVAREIGFKIHILTKGPRRTPVAWAEKLQWCQEHIAGDVDITITFDKGFVYGKVLVDDYPEYILRWLQWRPRGLVIMPVHDHNRSFSHPNVVSYDATAESLSVVRQRMQQAFNRPPKEVE
ncbi:MAG: hypothetical protein ABIP55_01695 [Tepidisphaeraceae bacterium]